MDPSLLNADSFSVALFKTGTTNHLIHAIDLFCGASGLSWELVETVLEAP